MYSVPVSKCLLHWSCFAKMALIAARQTRQFVVSKTNVNSLYLIHVAPNDIMDQTTDQLRTSQASRSLTSYPLLSHTIFHIWHIHNQSPYRVFAYINAPSGNTGIFIIFQWTGQRAFIGKSPVDVTKYNFCTILRTHAFSPNSNDHSRTGLKLECSNYHREAEMSWQ